MAKKNFKCQKTKLGSENKWIKISYLNLSTTFKFSGRNSQSQQKLVKKPLSFYKPNLPQHFKKYTPTTQPKTWFWLVSEKAFALHHFKNCILGALEKEISAYSYKPPFKHLWSRDVGSFYLVGLTNFLVLKNAKFFILIEILFWNSTII